MSEKTISIVTTSRTDWKPVNPYEGCKANREADCSLYISRKDCVYFAHCFGEIFHPAKPGFVIQEGVKAESADSLALAFSLALEKFIDASGVAAPRVTEE